MTGHPRRPFLPPAVWLLGGISLFTDTASEAIYPLLPLFLTTTLGATPAALGLIEGVAEATASGLKVASGYLSDRWRQRRGLVRLGYGLSTLVRPLMGVVATWPQALLLRFADRAGKGVRGAPRDAMLAAASRPEIHGRVFGFHRAMDHAGAVLGPLLATAVLWRRPGAYRTVFLLTIVPGLAVLGLLWRLPPDEAGGAAPARRPASTRDWRRLPRGFFALLGVLLVFSLGNSSDAFLLLRLSSLGVEPMAIPLLWALLHVVKATTSMAGGLLADRVGRRGVIASGWIVYAAVYAGFAHLTDEATAVALFLVYGLYFGLTEGVEKALVADLAPAGVRGTAFGVYHAAIGVGALLASVVFGAVWQAWGPRAAFTMGAALALIAAALLPWVTPDPMPDTGRRA